jgi:type IV secretory pathway TraG/TraD family ATPase VirD4
VGLSLGHDTRTGTALWGSIEDSYLYLGPPRSGKGVHLIISQTLDAPGPVLVTGTRPDTLHHTRRLRAAVGPVLTFDPQALAGSVPRLRWAPQRGCEDPLIAITRARALAAGAQPPAIVSANDLHWQQMSEAVLRCYLHATALSGRPLRDMLLWATRPTDPTPIRILRSEAGAVPGWAEELAAQSVAEPRQRDSVWGGVRRAVDSFADPRVLDACSPPEHDSFDPATFLAESGALYLVGTSGTQLTVAPLITALIEDILDTARRTAARMLGGRLDPPLVLLLDEAANIAPLPSLPNLLADGGGSGITTVAVLQSLAQARARWGDAAADALWDAATTKIVLGGLAHAEDLSRISRLAGEVDEPTRSRTTGPGGTTVTIAQRRVPALPIERIRTLQPGRVIVLARHTAPIEGRLDPWWRRPDATDIRDAVGNVS